MRLRFQGLEIESFKSFAGKHTLDLTEFGKGLHFVGGANKVQPRLGSNGAGKTSLWDSLCWGLFGRTSDNLRGPDVRPWGYKGSTIVTVFFTADKVAHKVFRSINPNKLLLDDRVVAQEHIDDLLRLNYDTFTNTILLAQGQPLFFDLKPAHKMELFSSALRLDRWDNYSKDASEWAKEIEEKGAGIEKTLLEDRTKLDGVLDQIRDAKERKRQWEELRASRLGGFEKELKGFKDQLEKLQKQYDNANLAFDGAMTEVEYYVKEGRKFAEALAHSQRQWDKESNAISMRRKAVSKLRKELEDLEDRKTCPTCGQKIRRDDIAEHRREIRLQIKELKAEGIEMPSKEIEMDLVCRRRDYNDNKTRIETFENKAKAARAELDVVSGPVVELKTKIKALESNREEWEQENNPHSPILQQLRKQKEQLTGKISETEDLVAKGKRTLSRVQFWIKGFKDVRLHVLNEVLQELEITTNSMLEDVGLIDWEVRYDVEKETKSGTVQRGLNVCILSPGNKGAVRWESFSGGEGQRLRLVSALALSEVLLNHAGVNPDLEILDEPTRHLSGEGVHDICDYLAERAQGLGKTIFLIDHMAVESTRFDSVLSVVKTKRGSELR
jgi:DNA repair exonuclease SbcCD ATPase subunit